MISFKVEIDPKNIVDRFIRLQRGLPRQIEQERKRLADIVLKDIKMQTPKRTGDLRESLHWVSVGKMDVLWGLRYGEWVITGTRPHVIRPKNKKFLRFVIDGEVIFTKLVNHPGTKANDFRQKGLAQTNHGEVLSNLTNWIKQVVS